MNTPYQSFMNGMQPFGYQPGYGNQVQYVNGLDSAKSYNLRPNESVILMDANNPIFYHKQADASGFCTIKAYRFEEIREEKPEEKYLTKKEFNDWLSQINAKQNGGRRNESSEK